MKAQSIIEKRERELRKVIKSIDGEWIHIGELKKQRYKLLENYWRALQWVLEKDDDEMCLTQGKIKSTNPPDSPLHSRADER